MPIEQSGNITAGHLVVFTANNVVQDGGPLAAAQKVLAVAQGVDFNATSDYEIALPSTLQQFQLTGIIITNASISLTTAVGGFYPTTSKGGTPIVAATQVYSALTASTKLLAATLASYGSTTKFDRNILTDWAIYFALTTAQGAAATADIYIQGIDLGIPS